MEVPTEAKMSAVRIPSTVPLWTLLLKQYFNSRPHNAFFMKGFDLQRRPRGSGLTCPCPVVCGECQASLTGLTRVDQKTLLATVCLKGTPTAFILVASSTHNLFIKLNSHHEPFVFHFQNLLDHWQIESIWPVYLWIGVFPWNMETLITWQALIQPRLVVLYAMIMRHY